MRAWVRQAVGQCLMSGLPSSSAADVPPRRITPHTSALSEGACRVPSVLAPPTYQSPSDLPSDLPQLIVTLIAMLSLFASSAAFQGPAMLAGGRSPAVQMRAEGEIGVTPPLGVYDPLNILATPVVYPRRDYRRYQELEIKHGRISMLACVGVITTEAGFRWPGYLSKSLDLKFSDVPGGALDSWAAVPAIGWFQIVFAIIFLELAYGATDPSKEPGDVGGITWIRSAICRAAASQPLCTASCAASRAAFCAASWFSVLVSLAPSLPQGVWRFSLVVEHAQQRVRAAGRRCSVPQGESSSALLACLPTYDAPEVKKFKLNAERNNGRAAMMGITGMITHNALGVDSLFPIVS